MANRNQRFIDDISKTFNGRLNWAVGAARLADVAELRSKMESIVSNCSKAEVKFCLMTEKKYSEAFTGLSAYSYYYMDDLLDKLCSKFPSLGDALLKSEVEKVRVLILQKCLYTDVKVLDEFAKSGTSTEKRQVAKVCSFKALRHLMKDDDKVVRKIAFERLGPAECLDEMLTDKMADIRAMGARAAPYGYKKIGEIIMKEIAKRPFTIMVTKVPREYLPLVLANRNMKNRWVAKIIQQRMDQ